MDLISYVPDPTKTMTFSRRTPCVQHICQVPREQDPLTEMILGSTLRSKLSRWFIGIRILSRSHPVTRRCLKSSKAMNYEINRHLKSYPYMIHPFSSFRIFWESTMTLFTVIVLLSTPALLTFYFDEHDKWYIFINAMDSVFICDIVIWFFTGYYDRSTQLVILNPRIVASKYLRGFFIFDTLPAIPFDWLIVMSESIWYLTSLNLLKILRIRTIIIYCRRLYYVYDIDFHFYRVAEIVIIIIISIHWAACLEYYVPLMTAKLIGKNDLSWIRSSYMEKRQTKFEIYLTCVNRAIIALVGSEHYLDVKTPEDIIYNLILTLLGFLGFIYLLARFSQLMTTFHSTSKGHMRLIQQLQQYSRHKELPHSLQRQLLVYYAYYNKKGFRRDELIVNHVSPYLREQLLLHNYSRLFNNVQLFKDLPQIVVTQLANALRSKIFMVNNVLVKAGTRGDALYYIASGTVAVYDNVGKEVCHLEDDAYFGEIALIMEDEYRIASIIAVENCEVYVLSRSDFQRVIILYPDLADYLKNIALINLEQMVSLQEAYKLESSSASKRINISSIKIKKLTDD